MSCTITLLTIFTIVSIVKGPKQCLMVVAFVYPATERRLIAEASKLAGQPRKT